MKETVKIRNCYKRYAELGGIINESDYNSILARAYNEPPRDAISVMQAGSIAKCSGIKLHNTKVALDKTTTLYEIMRLDKMPKGVEYHHCQMDDQRLFAEALRMIGDIDSLDKLFRTYPHITFF
ncbi:MAG: hypothetical protein WCT49_03040 [Candidatus Paceibacterota bacterium]|jgi:hypothetical protein|nr:hypothetical protein [Candidatus Paceibacterota bacterium]